MACTDDLAIEHPCPARPVCYFDYGTPKSSHSSVRVGIRTGFVLDEIPPGVDAPRGYNIARFSALEQLDSLLVSDSDEMSGIYTDDERRWQYSMEDEIMRTYMRHRVNAASGPLSFTQLIISTSRHPNLVVAAKATVLEEEFFVMFSPSRFGPPITDLYSLISHYRDHYSIYNLVYPIRADGIPYIDYYMVDR